MKIHDSYVLPPPTVPVAEHDGLIKIQDLANPIEVRIPIIDLAAHSDLYCICIDGIQTSIHRELGYPVPTDYLTLSIPASQFAADGTFNISYTHQPIPSGTETQSPPTAIRLDRTPPSGTSLGPIVFSAHSPDDKCEGFIYPYAGMETGDSIQTLCNGAPGPAYKISEANFNGDPVKIIFDKYKPEEPGTASVRVTYYVTDRAGNRSIESQSSELPGSR